MQRREDTKHVAFWIAGPPSLKEAHHVLMSLIDDLLALMQPFDVRFISSGEPRNYHWTARGRAALTEALVAKRIDVLHLEPAIDDLDGDQATALINLASVDPHLPDAACDLKAAMHFRPALHTAQVTEACTAFVTRWWELVQGAAAFVSTEEEDSGLFTTGHERQYQLPLLLRWPEVQHYVRGVFWGMGLGPGLCRRLGGQERVLREAPVELARPVGKGVWLQLSSAPPAPLEARARLGSYLAPLLRWAEADLLALRPPPVVPEQALSVPALPPSPRAASGAVPVEGWSRLRRDVSLNIYLVAPFASEQAHAVIAALHSWFAYSDTGRFGCRFHAMSLPSVDVDNAVLRCSVDLGSCDKRRAVQALAEQLAALQDATVSRLVLGTEEVS